MHPYILQSWTLVKFCFSHFPSEVNLFCLHFLCSAASSLSGLDSLCLWVSLDSKMNVFRSIRSGFCVGLPRVYNFVFNIFLDSSFLFKQLLASVFFFSIQNIYPKILSIRDCIGLYHSISSLIRVIRCISIASLEKTTDSIFRHPQDISEYVAVPLYLPVS